MSFGAQWMERQRRNAARKEASNTTGREMQNRNRKATLTGAGSGRMQKHALPTGLGGLRQAIRKGARGAALKQVGYTDRADSANRRHKAAGGAATGSSEFGTLSKAALKQRAAGKAGKRFGDGRQEVGTDRQQTARNTTRDARRRAADAKDPTYRTLEQRAATRLAMGKGGAKTLARAEGTSNNVQKQTKGKDLQTLINERRATLRGRRS